MKCRCVTYIIEDHNLPYFSRNRRAFSRKDGPPSISSSASRIGLPTTRDLIGRLSLPGSTAQNIVKTRTDSSLLKRRMTKIHTNL